MDSRKMKQMMNQMGIDLEEIDAEEVVIRTADEEMVFHEADVQRMDAQGQSTYQIVGEPDVRPRGEGGGDGEAAEATDDSAEAGDDSADEPEIPESDIEIVAGRTGASKADAREALAETDGDLAAAVERLE